MNLVAVIDLSLEAQASVLSSKRILEKSGVSGDFVSDVNLMLPIISLDDVDEYRFEAACAALMYAVEDLPVFRISLGELAQRDDGIERLVIAPPRIQRLYRAVVRELVGVGIIEDAPTYEPSIRLASKVTSVPDSLPETKEVKTRVRSISLLQKTGEGEAATYKSVYTVCLLKNYRRPENRMLFLDCDTCPYTSEAINEARRRKVHVAAFVTGETNINRFIRRNDPRLPRMGFWCATINVEGAGDCASSRIATLCVEGDVVVTNNRKLATICYTKGCLVVNSHSELFDDAVAAGEKPWFALEPEERLPFDGADPDVFGRTLNEALRFQWVGRAKGMTAPEEAVHE